MKRNFKVKALVFVLVALMVVIVMPKVMADEAKPPKYENSTAEASADVIYSLNADKTTVHPGDTVNVTLTLEKWNTDYGVNALSFRLYYNSDQLTCVKKSNGRVDFDIGDVGSLLNTNALTGLVDAAEVGYEKFRTLSFAGTTSDPEINSETDEVNGHMRDDFYKGKPVITMKFTVNEGASGPLDIYLKSANGMDGFNTSVSTYDNETSMWGTNTRTTFFVKSNLDELKVEVPAKSVKFKDELADGAKLDTGTNNTLDLNDYLIINPENTTDTISWSVDDSGVVSCDNGILTAKGKGTTKVHVRVGNQTAELTVTVTIPLQGIEFSDTSEVNLDKTTNPTMNIKNRLRFLPDGAEASNVQWMVDEEGIVTVSNGVLTAVGKGSTNVYAKVNDFETPVKIKVNVTVSVGSVSFGDNTLVALDTDTNRTKNLDDLLVINPSDADVKNKTWTVVEGQDVIDVDASGNVTVKKYGEAVVKVNVDGQEATIKVVVTVPLESITVDKENVTVYKGETDTVKVTAQPEGAVYEKLRVSFKEGGEYAHATVKDDGTIEIQGLKRGNAILVITANEAEKEGFSKEVNITVKENKITGVTIVPENEDEVLRGKTKNLSTTYTTEEDGQENPHATTDSTKVTWESLNPDVATVDQNGVVTGVKEGEAEIVAKMVDGTITDTYTVTIKEIHAEEIVFPDEVDFGDVYVDDVLELPFEIKPEGCTDTLEELLEYFGFEYDKDMLDVEVTYDPETGKGSLKVTTKKAGDAKLTVTYGEDENGDPYTWSLEFATLEKPVEEENSEAPDTGDLPIVMLAIVMSISLAGICVSKKILVK